MVKTRSSISPSASSKAMNPKNKSKETMSEGSDSGESELSSKRKRNNVGSKKGKHADRPLKKMKQVIEEDDVEYDSDDLEIGVPDSIKLCLGFSMIVQLIALLGTCFDCDDHDNQYWDQDPRNLYVAFYLGFLGVLFLEWEQYFKPESRVKGKMIFFPNTLENKVIANINAKLSPEQIRLFRKSCFGHLLDMKPILYQPQLIHNALLREVHQKNEKEMWFKFGCENFRFSLAEFAVITGLLCNGDNDMKKYAKRENAFVDKYFFEQQVTHGAVEQRFMFSEFKSDEYAVKMAILYLLTNGLICSPAVKKVSDELMNIVGLGEYDSFPWGKINDDDLVLTNEEEPVVEVEKAGDEMLVDNKCNVEEVLDVTNIENKNDGGSQPTFDIMCFITSQPGDEKGDDDKKEVVDDDHEMFKNGSNKLREDDNDGDDKGIGGDGVGAKEVKGGGNVGGSSGGVSAGESAVKEGKEVVSVNEKVADDEMIYEETKEFTGATEKLGDSQGTEDSITLSALEKINDIEETIAKGKVLHKEETNHYHQIFFLFTYRYERRNHYVHNSPRHSTKVVLITADMLPCTLSSYLALFVDFSLLLVVLLGKAEEDDEDVHVVEYSAEEKFCSCDIDLYNRREAILQIELKSLDFRMIAAPLMTLAVWVYFGFTVDGDEVAQIGNYY
ncbi:hypothetical protein F8388_002987 [Cannabis sativa]|uniref:DUF1985 domain-containing protein n=1 Tax=Cannabis sativa TaxID=3483 RepID=A0A7J6H4M7_CANSA|nr:hypothetical protein F8388_002987 [Cannabis sativa]